MAGELEGRIIKYAKKKVGTQILSVLDGMTVEYYGNWYNIYVNGNEATVEEV